MPVLDHEVHESVVEKSGAKYGCFNRNWDAHKGYYAPDRIYEQSRFSQCNAWVSHVMSKECRYDMSLTDRKCEGCCHTGSGERYAESVRSAAQK